MFAMTAIKGVGRRYANIVLKKADIDLDKRAGECSEEEVVPSYINSNFVLLYELFRHFIYYVIQVKSEFIVFLVRFLFHNRHGQIPAHL